VAWPWENVLSFFSRKTYMEERKMCQGLQIIERIFYKAVFKKYFIPLPLIPARQERGDDKRRLKLLLHELKITGMKFQGKLWKQIRELAVRFHTLRFAG
jgi:hypothetical protein